MYVCAIVQEVHRNIHVSLLPSRSPIHAVREEGEERGREKKGGGRGRKGRGGGERRKGGGERGGERERGRRKEEGEGSGVVLTWGVALYWMSFWREERATWTICGFFVSHANSRGWTTSSVSARTRRRQNWEGREEGGRRRAEERVRGGGIAPGNDRVIKDFC